MIQSRNQIIKDLKILAFKIKLLRVQEYLIKAASQDYEGKIDMTGRKTAFFVSPDLEDDVFIPTANLNRALDKDIVKVYVYNRRKGKRPEGEVIGRKA
jgi:ribonuclease R